MIRETYAPNHALFVWVNRKQKYDLSRSVLNIETTKKFGEAAGGFEISLTIAEADIIDQLQMDDFVEIWLDEGKTTPNLVRHMVGLINSITKNEDFARGRPVRSYTISGWDFGKLLVKSNIGWDLMLLGITTGGEEFATRLNAGMTMTGTAGEVCKTIYNNLFRNQVAVARKNMRFVVETDDNWTTFDQTLPVKMGSCWEALRNYANLPWNFLGTETAYEKSSPVPYEVFLEKAPFDEATGRLIPSKRHKQIIIGDPDIVRSSLRVDDTDRVNWFKYDLRMWLAGFGSENSFTTVLGSKYCTQYEPDSVGQHGFCPLEISSNFLPIEMKSHEVDKVKENPDLEFNFLLPRVDALRARFENNHLYRKGSMTVRGRPDIRAGSILIAEGYEYFVESVSHSYHVDDQIQYFVNVSLSRGEYRGGDARPATLFKRP